MADLSNLYVRVEYPKWVLLALLIAPLPSQLRRALAFRFMRVRLVPITTETRG